MAAVLICLHLFLPVAAEKVNSPYKQTCISQILRTRYQFMISIKPRAAWSSLRNKAEKGQHDVRKIWIAPVIPVCIRGDAVFILLEKAYSGLAKALDRAGPGGAWSRPAHYGRAGRRAGSTHRWHWFCMRRTTGARGTAWCDGARLCLRKSGPRRRRRDPFRGHKLLCNR